MGLDATLAKIKFKVNSDLEYEKIRNEKYIDLKKDNKKFQAWEETVWEEILYTSDWRIAHIIDSLNTGSKAVDFEENRDIVLNKEDIEIIINSMEIAKKNESEPKMKETYSEHITELKKCLETIDFEKETLLFGEWF